MSTMYTSGFGVKLSDSDYGALCEMVDLPYSPVRFMDDDEDPSRPLVLMKLDFISVLFIGRTAEVDNELPEFPAIDDVTEQEREAFNLIAPRASIRPIIVEE